MRFFLTKSVEELQRSRSTQTEKEVTKEEYMAAEHRAGFFAKLGAGEIATAAFNGNGISGHVVYENEIIDETVHVSDIGGES